MFNCVYDIHDADLKTSRSLMIYINGILDLFWIII